MLRRRIGRKENEPVGHRKSEKALKARSYKVILKVVPAQKIEAMVGMGLEGARYHLDQIKAALKTPGLTVGWTEMLVTEEQRIQLQGDVNRFHWHLRAFFWEVVGEMDLLRVVVRRSPKGVRAKLMSNWQQAHNSQWYSEVAAYRNFAHQSGLFVQCSYGGPSGELEALWLQPAIMGQPPNYDLVAQLSTYLENLGKLLKTGNA